MQYGLIFGAVDLKYSVTTSGKLFNIYCTFFIFKQFKRTDKAIGKMLLLPVWMCMLLGLLAGFLPVVGTEPEKGAKSNHGPTHSPDVPTSGSNCSQLTLKLEFSTKVVEHGRALSSISFICSQSPYIVE